MKWFKYADRYMLLRIEEIDQEQSLMALIKDLKYPTASQNEGSHPGDIHLLRQQNQGSHKISKGIFAR